MFSGLPYSHLDPLVTSTNPDADPAPDPSLFPKSVERTKIILAKNLILIIKHIIKTLKLLISLIETTLKI
jgi:hypothetical protein